MSRVLETLGSLLLRQSRTLAVRALASDVVATSSGIHTGAAVCATRGTTSLAINNQPHPNNPSTSPSITRRGMFTQSLVSIQHTAQQSQIAHPQAVTPLHLRAAAAATPPAAASVPTVEPLSMKAAVMFETCWNKMLGRLKDYVSPREIVWLNGAPGSGKGTNIPYLMKIRGISRAVTMSQLLDASPDIKGMIDKGELVPDTMVLDALLDAVLNPDRNDGNGLVIDGFPRTAMQVDFVKLLYDKLMELHLRHADGPEEFRFPRPSFKVVILYVDEEESVRRQLNRARLAKKHNQRVLEAGTGEMWDVRTTDVSEALCRRRYQVFKAHYHTILRLKNFFAFSLIDAMGTMEECRSQIIRELRYQSSLDLDAKTYQAIRHLPLARDLVRAARQRLVFRLDAYCKRQPKLFHAVIKLIDSELLPLLKQCSLAGHAEFKSQNPTLVANPGMVDMLIDILSDRGFSVAHSVEDRLIPAKINLVTGEVENRGETVHKFRITFDKENVRDLATPVNVTTRGGEEVAIGTTVVPEHMRREDKQRRELEPASMAKSAAEYVGVAAAAAASAAAASAKYPFTEKPGSPAVAGPSKAVNDAQSVSDDEVRFLSGFDSMDHELNSAAAQRYYGYDILDIMNDRED